MREIPLVDMNDPKNQADAKKADEQSTGASGKYIAEIAEASLEEYPGGSVSLTLGLRMPNGKFYRQAPKQIIKADGTPGFYDGQYKALMGLIHATNVQGTAEVDGGDFIDGAFVPKKIEVPSFVDFLGKKVGVVVHVYQKYPESLGINGYTDIPIPTKVSDENGYNTAKELATTIWMPNFEKKPQPVFDFVIFFDPETGKNYGESIDDQCFEPKAVDEALEKIMEKVAKERALRKKKIDENLPEMTNKEWDELRIKKLKASFKKNQMQYDAKDFIPRSDSGITGTEEIPQDDVV